MARIFSDLQELLEFDKAKAKGFRFLFGVDEAGRGPLAGPVVAAAVHIAAADFTCRIGDSKLLSAAQREKAFAEIHERAIVGVGIVSEKVIDEVNILRASHLAMSLAVKELTNPSPLRKWHLRSEGSSAEVKVLIDGNSYHGDIPYKVECVVKGDAKSFAIACASIVAKVTRDRIMDEYHKTYPQYGFDRHKGYPTSMHRDAIRQYGPALIHRKTFTLL